MSLADGLGNHSAGTDDIFWTVLAKFIRCFVFMITNHLQTRRTNNRVLFFSGSLSRSQAANRQRTPYSFSMISQYRRQGGIRFESRDSSSHQTIAFGGRVCPIHPAIMTLTFDRDFNTWIRISQPPGLVATRRPTCLQATDGPAPWLVAVVDSCMQNYRTSSQTSGTLSAKG
ncbi:hypothetical protein BDP55DRAFT_718101 [Colletotrichum godetiae]|uniref:Uncharacterized protein n=1 Tax=Colletotrichum godetiae TaxID=1209918 RepID=A0AAJ0AEJ3_9PEZI|nr:uncharacterized protein BDP55DRAFT_718101 [Colletotrichum godetiae]KAK1672432.1 hypothetical protein BDP55DRAFT_718101 [Colletotrichum godetiae]